MADPCRASADPALARRRELGLIHTGRGQLGMGEPEYRLMLQRVTGKSSAAELTAAERHLVIDELRRLGFKAPRRRPLAEPQQRMIRGLWIDLAKREALRDRSDRALDAFVKRQSGVDRLEWLDVPGCAKVIEALKAWLARAASGAGGHLPE